MKRALLASLLLFVAVSSSRGTGATARPPFSGWLKAELEQDSIWFTCMVSVFVDERARGSLEAECRTPEGARTVHVKDTVADRDIEELRHLLREADLFQGQFWGHDLRGIDLMLGTLTVNDETKVARVVCYKNESFETGPREQLLKWLTKRLPRPGGTVHK